MNGIFFRTADVLIFMPLREIFIHLMLLVISILLLVMFFSMDWLVTKNQTLNTNLASSLFDLKRQQKLWLTFGVQYLGFSTDHGRMMAVCQILYSQNHIWVRSEKQSFLQKKKLKKELPKCEQKVRPKIHQIPQNLFD